MNSSSSSHTHIEIPDAKMIGDSGTMSGPLVAHNNGSGYHGKPCSAKRNQLGFDIANAVLRILCIAFSCVALAAMASNHQSATISVFGLQIPVFSKWSYSDAFEFLVGASAAAAVHSVLQLLLCAMKMMKRTPTIPTRNHAWLLFAGDQIFAYGIMAAGSSAAAVTNLNRTGIRHADLPNLCKPLHRFCDKATVSIAFAFFSFLVLEGSVVLDVIWLSKN